MVHLLSTGFLSSHLPYKINHCKCLGYFMPVYDRLHKFQLTSNLVTLSEDQGHSNPYPNVQTSHIYLPSLTEISSQVSKCKSMLNILFLKKYLHRDLSLEYWFSSSWRSQSTRSRPLGRWMTSSSPAPACSRRVWSSGKCWQATRDWFRVRTASTSAVGRPSPTRRVPTWRIGERPPDMRVSCDISRACPDE